MVVTIEIIKEAPNADQKSFTSNASLKRAVSINIAAFITNENNLNLNLNFIKDNNNNNNNFDHDYIHENLHEEISTKNISNRDSIFINEQILNNHICNLNNNNNNDIIINEENIYIRNYLNTKVGKRLLMVKK